MIIVLDVANTPDLADLLGSWELHLRAERKSPQTVKSYGDGVRAYITWCETNDKPAVIDRRQLREFIDGLLTSGASPPRPSIGIWRCGGSPDGSPMKANRLLIHCWV